MPLIDTATALDHYMAVATTFRMYSERKGAVGGFPNETALVRYQWGKHVLPFRPACGTRYCVKEIFRSGSSINTSR
jgi:hypothetical protein